MTHTTDPAVIREAVRKRYAAAARDVTSAAPRRPGAVLPRHQTPRAVADRRRRA